MGMRIHLLPLGDEAGPTPASYALFGVDLSRDADKRPFGWEESLDFNGTRMAGLRSPLTMWLIEGGDRTIVVDTGWTPGGRPEMRAALHEHDIWTDHRPQWTIDAQLARFGLRPEDVDVVVNTCCHFDHIGNNTRFTNATFFVQRSEFVLGVHPPAWAPYYYCEFAHNLLDVRDRLELITGDVRLAPGVTLHHLGGHSPGTQVVLVETDAGRVCLPGDLVPFYKNLELNWPTGIFFNVEDVMRAYAWMRANADIVLPHHDWKYFEVYPGGSVG